MIAPNMLTQLKTCSNRGVPLVGIVAADQGATTRKVLALFGDRPKLVWDGARGLVGENALGQAAVEELGFGPASPDEMGPPRPEPDDPTKVFPALLGLPPKAVVVVLNAHLIIRSDYPGYQKVIQAIWNLRDPFKDNGRMLLMLGPILEFPPELNQDVIVLEDPRPTREEVAALVEEQHAEAIKRGGKLPDLTPEVKDEATRAALGFPLFLTEQIVAVSIEPKSPGGINLPTLWLRKKAEIKKLQGTTVHEEGTFATVGGHEEAKHSVRQTFGGRRKPEACIMFDELEKGTAGHGTDSSGTTGKSVGTILKVLQDWGVIGYMFTGVARSGKSALAKAIALEFGIPVIGINLEQMESKYVGETNIHLMAALNTARAIGNGKLLAIAVTNSVKALPGELVGRFDLGTYFFDLATEVEHEIILDIYSRKYEMPPVGHGDMPNLKGWTGNDIRRWYEKAFHDNIPLAEAARSIIPYGIANRKLIESQRAEAHGVYLSSSYPGVYQRKQEAPEAPGRSYDMREEG
jgi:ATPase family associated with various cellular activities (AAA)